MADPNLPFFPVLEVAAFLDATTVVIVGHRVEEIGEGEELYIVGQSDTLIPKANVPLVSPKATVVVTGAAGAYVVARSPAEEEQVLNFGLGGVAEALSGTRTVIRRAPLTKDDAQFLGDPGKRPIRVGDPVVRTKNLGNYVTYLASLVAK